MINNINVNINQINNIQIKKEYNTSSLNKPKTKSMNKIINSINTNMPKRPNTNYNAFKAKPKSINKIPKTEEKGIKKVRKRSQFQNLIYSLIFLKWRKRVLIPHIIQR